MINKQKTKIYLKKKNMKKVQNNENISKTEREI